MLQYYNCINCCFVVVSFIILISSIDDFFIDICYWTRAAYRQLFIRRKYEPLKIETLRANPERFQALMIPAWDESAILAQMIRTNEHFTEYENYMFFVGVYPNDEAGIRETDKIAAEYSNVRKVVLPHDGPTCKADCLNWIVQAVLLFEKQNGVTFDAFVMHDGEDIIHPLELKLFNHLISRMDLIQIPVRGLEGRWCDFVRGTYVDEFAEHHGKEMPVREALVGVVPSAGVASCFSRRAILALNDENREGMIFNTDTLTEDYDISYRLSRHNLRQIFVKFPIDLSDTHAHYGKHAGRKNKKIPVAVAEYFPNDFWAAVRQKARWIIGIDFQGFGKITWEGGFFRKYFFLHDRKGLVTSTVMPIAYFLLLNIVAFRIGEQLFESMPRYIFTLPVWLVWSNIFFLSNRALQRMFFTTRMYDIREGLLSFPRIFVGNAVNFCATARATWIFCRHLLLGEKIAWDKTAHEYPSIEILEKRYKKLGEILLDRCLIDAVTLKEALDEQKRNRRPLGRILIDKGAIGEQALHDAISLQAQYADEDGAKRPGKTLKTEVVS